MAKEIKVIKCPHCGSVNKTQLRPDFYQCNSCQTEYFLDTNDVTINYNHNYNHSNQTENISPATVKTVTTVIGVVIAAIIAIFVLNSIFSSKKQTGNIYSLSSAPNHTGDDEEDRGYSASRYSIVAFLQPSTKQPILLLLENRNYNSRTASEANDGSYISFYNPVKKKMLAEIKISNEDFSSSDFKSRTFSDGNVYIVNNKTTFLKLDKENLKITDVGEKFFKANNALQIGVATMEFVYDNYGDGLILLTNDGKKRYYYPLIQKLYTEDEFYNATKGFNTLLPSAKNKTIHLFTSKSTDYPEDKLQLLKVTYTDNGPGAKDVLDHVSWNKDYGGSGIFTDRDPYKKVLITQYNVNRSRLLNWKDLTPDRLYFEPSVMLDDAETLIIQFRANANTKSDFKIQQINSANGAVIWTTNLPKDIKIEKIAKYKDGFFATSTSDEMILFDTKGNITSNYKLN